MRNPLIHRHLLRLHADARRVVARFFRPGDEGRQRRIVERVLALSEAEVQSQLEGVRRDFAHRHRDFEAILRHHAVRVAPFAPPDATLSRARTLLLGAVFTMEYSIEAAALFNPSIVLHPDQGGLAAGEARVILSLRATGEGHLSSVEFRSGTLSADGDLRLDPASPLATLPEIVGMDPVELRFSDETDLSERVLFPVTPDESNGIEDVRLVRFMDDDGSARYVGTYTAYDGHHIRPKLIETDDFRTFRLLPLGGDAAANKGMALFPRRIAGQYAMLARQDNESNFLMFSDDLQRWDTVRPLRGPAEPWEVVQIGNNGSPIETDAGWLVLTHGVGPMRTYRLGAELLDLDDPSRIVARLRQPLLAPDETEREGYVPNVVYSCGALTHRDRLVLPYAMSDAACGVATALVQELLSALTHEA